MAEGIVPVKLLVENAAPSILVQFAIDGGMVPVKRLSRTLTRGKFDVTILRCYVWIKEFANNDYSYLNISTFFHNPILSGKVPVRLLF